MIPPAGPRLSAPGVLGADGGTPRFDCVVVGSGFGASVFAARLAEQLGPGRVAVLERGPELRPGEFPETLAEAAAQIRSPAAPMGIFELLLQRDLDALVANVLGGGSQLYAAVTLEPLPQTFDIRRDPADPTSARAWPEGIDAQTLRPYFDRVRQALEVERWVDSGPIGSAATGSDSGAPLRDHAGREVRQRPQLRRAAAFDRAAAAVGAPVRTVPLALNLTRHHGTENRFGVPRSACTGCGNCITGCNVGAKNALTANYLPIAVAAGAEIHTGVEVLHLRPAGRAGHRWTLLARVHRPDRPPRFVTVRARMVVLGAGVFGTAGILFASRRRGLPVPPLLGTRVSGNGDAIMLARRWAAAFGRGLPRETLTEPGPTITRMADLRDRPDRRHLIQDAVAPAALAGLLARITALGAGDQPALSVILWSCWRWATTHRSAGWLTGTDGSRCAGPVPGATRCSFPNGQPWPRWRRPRGAGCWPTHAWAGPTGVPPSPCTRSAARRWAAEPVTAWWTTSVGCSIRPAGWSPAATSRTRA